MTKDILFNIIAEVHNAGFEVVALVSDMGPTNVGLWKNLVIKPSTSWLENPITNKRVHVFADVPHLLKLARNHFIDKGFDLPENIYVGRFVLEEYLKISKCSDFELAFQFSDKHINVSGTLRQNVKLAPQVFSNRLAEALCYCGKKNMLNMYNWKEVCILYNFNHNLIYNFNFWF